nr:hypothetical protein [uncultured Pseudodesulfovibrio sp.]
MKHRRIIEIGKTGVLEDDFQSFSYLGKYMENARQIPILSAEDHADYIKGCVLLQNFFKEFETLGGYENISRIFLTFKKKYPEKEKELADWIFQHNKRETYAPYGSRHCVGVKSLEEYERVMQDINDRVKANS